MGKINTLRVLLGGLVASIVFIIIQLIVEGVAFLIFGFNEAALARQYFPAIILSGTAYQIVNFLYLIFTCTITIWLYAALGSKFGSGTKTALIAGLFVIILIFLFTINKVNMGIFPLKVALISLAIGLVEFPVSIVAGSTFYKSK